MGIKFSLQFDNWQSRVGRGQARLHAKCKECVAALSPEQGFSLPLGGVGGSM